MRRSRGEDVIRVNGALGGSIEEDLVIDANRVGLVQYVHQCPCVITVLTVRIVINPIRVEA